MKYAAPLFLTLALTLAGCSNHAPVAKAAVDPVQRAEYQKVENDTSLPLKVRQAVRQQEVEHRDLSSPSTSQMN